MATVFDLRPQMRRDNVVLYHDIVCPWCYVGLFQAARLEEQFGIEITWLGAELFPPDLDGPPSNPGPRPAIVRDPAKPNRFDDFAAAEGVSVSDVRPGFVRSHRALLALEFAKTLGHEAFNLLNTAIYKAYWETYADIENIDVLRDIASGVGIDADAMAAAVANEAFADQILPFDDGAYGAGVRNVPTFIFGANEVLAEANYDDLARAMERFLLRVRRLPEGTL
ncbi:MAG: hypothetical protein RLZZ78_1181 [Armatimonadota bacterium]|jgi:predicted DsbA family dithiol-disulfide isomerase